MISMNGTEKSLIHVCALDRTAWVHAKLDFLLIVNRKLHFLALFIIRASLQHHKIYKYLFAQPDKLDIQKYLNIMYSTYISQAQAFISHCVTLNDKNTK